MNVTRKRTRAMIGAESELETESQTLRLVSSPSTTWPTSRRRRTWAELITLSLSLSSLSLPFTSAQQAGRLPSTCLVSCVLLTTASPTGVRNCGAFATSKCGPCRGNATGKGPLFCADFGADGKCPAGTQSCVATTPPAPSPPAPSPPSPAPSPPSPAPTPSQPSPNPPPLPNPSPVPPRPTPTQVPAPTPPPSRPPTSPTVIVSPSPSPANDFPAPSPTNAPLAPTDDSPTPSPPTTDPTATPDGEAGQRDAKAKDGKKSNTALIIGVTVAVVALLLICAFAFYRFRRNRRRENASDLETSPALPLSPGINSPPDLKMRMKDGRVDPAAAYVEQASPSPWEAKRDASSILGYGTTPMGQPSSLRYYNSEVEMAQSPPTDTYAPPNQQPARPRGLSSQSSLIKYIGTSLLGSTPSFKRSSTKNMKSTISMEF